MYRTRFNTNCIRLTLLTGCLLLSLSAHAQTSVHDATHTAVKKLETMLLEARMKAQESTMVQQLDTLRQQYEQLSPGAVATDYGGRAGLLLQLDLRLPGEGVAERCTALANPSAKQRSLCVAMVGTENQRHNVLVQMEQLNNTRIAELQAIYAERAQIAPEQAGRLQANDNRLAAFQSRVIGDAQNYENILVFYDLQLEVLSREHARAAQELLDGQNRMQSLTSNGLRAAALATAFAAAARRER